MMRNKSLIMTITISTLLFTFLIFLIYLVYCYTFYDRDKENNYIAKFNNAEYQFVYDHLANNQLSYDDFLIPINIMYNKNNLTQIYNTYYSQSSIELTEFLDTYYYGNRLISHDNVTFETIGKTSLIKRAELKYQYIEVFNKIGKTSTIGLLNDITIEINDNSLVEIDGHQLDCSNNKCSISAIYGGLHKLKYQNNNITYFCLVNINKDKGQIDVNLLDNLVNIKN